MKSVCAAARGVVDDALDPARASALTGHDVPPVAERDDRLLERDAELRADECVQPAPQPVVGDADGRPQAAEPRRRGIEQLADRVEAARQRRAQRRQRVEVAAEVAQERPPLVGQEAWRAAPWRRASSAISRNWPGRAGRRARPARWPARCRAPRRCRRRAAPGRAPAPGRSRRGRARRSTGSFDGSRASARRRRRARTRSPPRAARGRAGTRGARASARPWRAGQRRRRAGRRTGGRARRTARAARPTARPRSRSPIRGVATTSRPARRSGAARGGAATPGRTGRCRPASRSMPNAAVDQARSAGQAIGGERADPVGGGARPVGRQAASPGRRPQRRGRPASPRCPSSGSTARIRTAAAAPAGSVTTLRQSYIP